MPQNRLAVVLVAFAVSVLLLPGLAAAETFNLPSKQVLLESWHYYPELCPNTEWCRYQNYLSAYTPNAYLVYRVLIKPDGSQQILDTTTPFDDVHNYYPDFYHSLSAFVPELTIELTESGNYSVELRKISAPLPTKTHASTFNPDSVVDWWIAEHAKPGPGVQCADVFVSGMGAVDRWNDNDCWVERLKEQNVKLSDKSVLIESYDDMIVTAPFELPSDSDAALGERQSIGAFINSPFSDNNGVAQTDNDKAMAGMALLGLAGIGAVGTGAYVYRSRAASTVGSFTVHQTAAGKANDAAVLAEKEKIRKMDEAYEEKMRQYNLKKSLDAQAAALSVAQADAQSRQDQLATDYAAIQGSKSYADAGSAYALLASKYGDILTDDGKKQLMDASNQAWSANTTVTAVFSPMVLAKQADPVQPQPAKNDYYSVNNLWDDLTGAVGGLGKTVYLGAKEQYDQYSDIASTALKGDISGANQKLLQKNLSDVSFVGQAVINHWEEIGWGIVVAAGVVAAVVTAPVWVPFVAAAVGVSAATVTAVGVGVGAAAAVGTAYYAATTYGAKLNNVDDVCTLEDGSATACVDARTDVVEQGIVDGTILAASVGVGSVGSTWAKAAAKAKMVDHPKLLKAIEAILKLSGVKTVKNTEYLTTVNALGEYDLNTRTLTYGKQTRFGDLMHEVLHSTQHAKAGYPTISQDANLVDRIKWNIMRNKNEVGAYTQDLQNVKAFGYSENEMMFLKSKVAEYQGNVDKLVSMLANMGG